ncbi:hypothetical protein Tco_1385576 [Tanacetum coccineum]
MSTITDIKSVLTQKNLDALCRKFHIPEEVHPQLPTPDQTIHDKPEGKIGIYTRFFDFANYRLPLSSFFVTVLRYFRINFSQLSVIGVAKVSHFEILCRVHNIEPTVGLFRCFYTHFKNKGWISFCKRTEGSPVCYTKPIDSLKNWNNRFFWVDSFACPALFRWHTDKSVSKDPPPKPTDFNAEHYAMLVAHPAPFRKFSEVFLCLVGISRYYPLDEETYPSFRDENDEVMDLSTFINVADPTLVKVVERERVEGEAKLLETTVGRTVPLLPVAPVRSEASLEDSVNRLFDEGGSGNQADSAIGIDQNIVVEPEVEHVAAETEIVKKVARHHKKRPAAADASGSNHPPKKLREDYGTSGGHASGGKSPSVIRELLASSILNAEVGVAAIPTLPFVTSSVSATPEKDGDDFTDAVTGPNLRTIGPSVRFFISPDSSYHSSTKATEAEVESIPRSVDPPIMTEAMVTTEATGVSSHLFPKTVVDTSSRFGPDLFLNSDSADIERPVTASTAQRPGKELSMGSREVDFEALHKTFVPRWNIPNDTLLDKHDISREFIDHLVPLVLFSQIHKMDYHHLFTEFNVGTARQAYLNAEVRMQTEFCLSERTRLEVEYGRQASLLKSKDEEIEVLKAQLTVKEAEGAEAIRLRAQIVAMERAYTDEVNALQHNNAVLECEKNTFNDKVVELQSSLSAKDLEAKELAAREVDSEALHEIFVPRWNVPNDTLLDEHDISREFIDHLAPPVLFSQIRNMDYHHLFTEFNVGTARQACLNVEVRMRTEFCLSERTRLEVKCGRQASLLKSKDEEIEVLKAQLTVKEAEAAEAIRLRTQFVAMERVHTDETLRLAAIAKSQNDSLVDQVNVLEGACSELREQVSAYESLKEQIEEFQDEQMRVMFDKLAKLEEQPIAVAIEKGIASWLATVIEHLRIEFSLLFDLKSNKDASTETVMNLLRLSDPLANLPGRSDLQPDVEQLMVPIHRPEDQVVLGASSLTFSLSVSHDRVERIRRNIAEHRSALAGVFAPLAEPFSVQSLTGAVNTSDAAPSAAATTTALSTTFASASTIPPVSVDDYVVADVVNEENVQPNVEYKGEGSAAADINFEKEELDTTP